MQTEIAAGCKIPNISASVHEAEMMLIYGGSFAKVLQYISKGGRGLPTPFGNHKNEGWRGKAKTFVAFVASTHVRLSF